MGRLSHHLRTSWQKNLPQYRALALLRYPAFVYLPWVHDLGDQLPVFVFHSLEPRRFEMQLRYLSENGYRTARADELVEVLTGVRPLTKRTVVLSFDDGLTSLWTIGHPLLRKYGQVGIAFVVAGLVPEGEARPTLEDVWRGTERESTVAALERNGGALANWAELRRMAEVGTVDIQSHSWNHDRVFVSSRIVEFLSPWFDYWHFGRVHLPVYLSNGVENFGRGAPLGTPIYESMPRLQAQRRFMDDETLRESCVSLVRQRGGEAFFREPGWENTLRAHVQSFRDSHGLAERFASEDELNRSVRNDLGLAREIIEWRLGAPVRHLCFPWFYGSRRAVAISREVGYVSNFWGDLPSRRTNRPGDDPFHVVRLPDEYVFSLPGAGRRNLAGTVAENVRRHAGPFLSRMRNGGRCP